MLTPLKDCLEFHDFFVQFVRQQLHQRYQSSVLGFLWTLLNPLLLFLSFSLIFSILNGADLKVYGVYFFSGYMAWIFFSAGLTMATESVVANSAYLTRIRIPTLLFPLAGVAVSLVDFAVSFLVLAALMAVTRAPFSPALVVLPASVLLLTAFVCGLGLIFAVFNVFVRDFRHLLSSILFLWFFFSPILFRLDKVPPSSRTLFEWNPFLPFLRLFQAPISGRVFPAAHDWLLSGILAVVCLIVGYFVFIRNQNKFSYLL